MVTVAHITVPGHMTPSLARACGELLAAGTRQPGLSEFISLALLYQSWDIGQPSGLGMYFIRMCNQAFSENVKEPLQALSNKIVYVRAVEQDDVPQARALSAYNAAKNMAEHLRTAEMAVLQTYAAQLLNEILSGNPQEPYSLARTLALGLCEQIRDEHPELARANSFVVGIQEGQKIAMPIPRPSGDAVASSGSSGLRKSERESKLGIVEKVSPLTGPVLEEGRPTLKVFDRLAVIELLEKMPPPMTPLDGNVQQFRMLERMANDHGMRAVTEVPAGNPLASLYRDFPHFTEVLDFINHSLVLAGCGDEGRPAIIPPILLRGDPGVGKTYFGQELARVLGSHFIERDLSVTSEAFVISGLDSGFKGSKPGLVFDALVNSKTANPVILLNELDKVQARGTHNSPVSALYALLEPTSATRFVDEFIPVEIDASRIIWICTANEGEIPEPILSRFDIFNIRQPTHAECRNIAASVWRNVCATRLPKGHGFPETLGEATLEAVANMNPRVMRKALRLAASYAVIDGRRFVLTQDLNGSYTRYVSSTRAPIGFGQGK